MRVVKRKRKGKEYYYLQHSYRKGPDVSTREKYLGTVVPDDVERLEQAFLDEIKKETLYKRLEMIRRGFQKEWKRFPGAYKEKFMQQLTVAFTYNTNAIEGSTITYEETEGLVERGIAPHRPLRDIKETEAHAALFLLLLEKKQEPTLRLMLAWHAALFSQTKPDMAGKLRDYLVRVGPYRAPDWQDVPALLKELFSWKHTHAVEFAAHMHYRFEKIHPFGDGNGRVGRLLMNAILWNAGYPILIIEYKKRNSYYRALQNEEKFVQYFFRRYLSAHKEYE